MLKGGLSLFREVKGGYAVCQGKEREGIQGRKNNKATKNHRSCSRASWISRWVCWNPKCKGRNGGEAR